MRCLGLTLLFTFFAWGAAQDTADPVVLRINGTEVTRSSFDERFEFYIANLASQQGIPLNDETRGQLEEAKPAYVQQLASELGVLQQGRLRGLTISDAFIEEQVATVKDNFDSEEAYLASMGEAGISGEPFLRSLIADSALSRETLAAIESEVEVSDLQVQLFYDANRAALTRPGEVCARHILVETEAEAEEIQTALASGESFETLAQERSIDPGSGARGGDLGCFGRGQMVPPFEEAAFTTEIDTISAPVESQFGYHLVLPYERREGGQVPLEEVEERIREELRRRVVQRVIQGYVETADVETFEENLTD